MTHVTCRLTAKNRDQLRNPTLGSRVWAAFTFLRYLDICCRLLRADVIVRYPKFDGTGYLALPVLRDADLQFVIDVDFRPDVTSSGATPTSGHVELLLFSSDRDDAQFDFFSVTRLHNGQIEFRFVLLLIRYFKALY